MSGSLENPRPLVREYPPDWGGAFTHAVKMLLLVLTLVGLTIVGGWIDGRVFGDRTDTWSTLGSNALMSICTGLISTVFIMFTFRRRFVRRRAVQSFALLCLGLTLWIFVSLLAKPLPWWQEFGLSVLAPVVVLIASERIWKHYLPKFWIAADGDDPNASRETNSP